MYKVICRLAIIFLLLLTGCTSQDESNKLGENNKSLINEEKPDKKQNDNVNQPDVENSNEDKGSLNEKDNRQKVSNQPESPPQKNEESEVSIPTSIVAGNMEPSIQYSLVDGTVNFHFKVKNQKEHPFTFHFDTNQQYDYMIMNEKGEIVVHYSKSHSFKKIATERFIKPGGSLNYKVSVKDLAKGTYTVIFTLTAKEMQPKAMVDFVVK